jgi:transglutaminase-like putative cysteine protease
MAEQEKKMAKTDMACVAPNGKLQPNNADLIETYYCNFTDHKIQEIAETFNEYIDDIRKLVRKMFNFVRDDIVFGGDRWKIKASETLNKRYGACYNKNLLLVSLLRYYNIPSRLCANPMSKSFLKPSVGLAHLTISTPFYHCFTKVYIDSKWIDIDPTLDKTTYDTFFKPLNVEWKIDWDGYNNMELYSDSVIGVHTEYADIDKALNDNLDSHFLFRFESEKLLKIWLSIGNAKMWKKTQNAPKKNNLL